MGVAFPERIENIHICGEGLCTLLGADHPRATGDGSKILANPCPYDADEICRLGKWTPEQWHDYSYGTDAGKEGESQYGDWRGIGILFANVEHCSVANIRIVDSHGWGISLEACAHGHVSRIVFDAHMHKMIDGLRSNMENQDGIDLRNGCHHIIVSDITGTTGDDIVALTAVAGSVFYPGGSLRNILISNVSSGGLHAINIAGYLTDSVITNVIYRGLSPDGIKYGRPGCTKSVSVSNYVHGCYQN